MLKFKRLLIFFIITLIGLPICSTKAAVSNQISSLVLITCVSSDLQMVKGSGVIVSDDGKILTNAHVIAPEPSKQWGCWGGIITKDNSFKPDKFFNINFFYNNITNDLAFGKIDSNLDGQEQHLDYSDTYSSYPFLKINYKSEIGQEVWAAGYPGIADGNLNITKGLITSKAMVGDYNYLLSDVSVSYGNSGGAVVNKDGELLGLATSVKSSDLAKTTYVLDVNSLRTEKLWIEKVANANPDIDLTAAKNFITDLLAITQQPAQATDITNKNCIDLAVNSMGAQLINGQCVCNKSNYTYNTKLQMCLLSASPTNSQNERTNGKIDTQFSKKMSGRILLQTESHGEAWYVNPKDNKRYYMANGQAAFEIMRRFGVGISNKDLQIMQINKRAALKNSGRIYLQIESHGEAYYIDFKGNLHYLKNGSEAYKIMRDLGLGITNNDLNRIPQAL